LKSNIERIEALEKQDWASEETVDVLLEFARIIGEETGHDMKILNRKIKALRQGHLKSGQQRLQ
jgi:uncharacterized protein (UPF0335 family)